MWRELWGCHEKERAESIATVIEAMGFPARVGASSSGAQAWYRVDVTEDDHADLAGVLPELLDEQHAFDEHIAFHGNRSRRVRRWLVLLFGAIAMTAAVLGYIEL